MPSKNNTVRDVLRAALIYGFNLPDWFSGQTSGAWTIFDGFESHMENLIANDTSPQQELLAHVLADNNARVANCREHLPPQSAANAIANYRADMLTFYLEEVLGLNVVFGDIVSDNTLIGVVLRETLDTFSQPDELSVAHMTNENSVTQLRRLHELKERYPSLPEFTYNVRLLSTF